MSKCSKPTSRGRLRARTNPGSVNHTLKQFPRRRLHSLRNQTHIHQIHISTRINMKLILNHDALLLVEVEHCCYT